MGMRIRRCRAPAALAILGGVFLPATVTAWPDLYLRGALSVAGVEDDNLFFTAVRPERDFISRVTPEIEAGSLGPRMSLTGRYTFDAERFAEHPELTTPRARQNASIDLKSDPARSLALTVHGEYVSTLTPGDLNLQTGLTAGRLRARRLSAGPSLKYRFSPLTSGTVAYTQTRDDLSGGLASSVRTAALGLERRTTPRDTMKAGYTINRFHFEQSDVTTAHALSFGWDHRITPRTGLALSGGPRFFEGEIEPEASMAIRHGSKRADVSLTYARGLATVIGRAGTVTTESLAPAFTYRSARLFRVSVAPAFFRIRGKEGGDETRVSLINLEAACRLGPRMSLEASYHRSLQEGTLAAGPGGAGAIARNIVQVRLVARHDMAPRGLGRLRIGE
jgi:hypothetical protein